MNAHELLANPDLEKQAITWLLSNSEHFRERFSQAEMAGVFTDPVCLKLLAELKELFCSRTSGEDQQLRLGEASLPQRLEEFSQQWEHEWPNLENLEDFDHALSFLRDLAKRRAWVRMFEQAKIQCMMLNRGLDSVMEEVLFEAGRLRNRWDPSALSSQNREPIHHTASDVSNGKFMTGIDEVERDHQVNRPKAGITSGFSFLDSRTSGFQPGKLYLFLGDPGIGTAALLLSMARAAFQGEDVIVGISGSNQESNELHQIFFSGWNGGRSHTEKATTQSSEEMIQSVSEDRSRLDIQYSPTRSFGQIKNQLRALNRFNKPAILFVDDVQALEMQAEPVLQQLRDMALSHSIPIVAFVRSESVSVESDLCPEKTRKQEQETEKMMQPVSFLMWLECEDDSIYLSEMKNEDKPGADAPFIRLSFDAQWLRLEELKNEDDVGGSWPPCNYT